MIENIVTTPGINKKFLPKYRGPYKISRVLDKNRYVIKDINGGMQLKRIPYLGICSPSNILLYIS